MTKHFHVGAKTRMFEALEQPHVVVAFETGVHDGAVEALDGPSPALVKTVGSASKGFKAFRPVPGAIYEAVGVVYEPVVRKAYVHFDPKTGFHEISEEEARRLAATEAPLPELIGTARQRAEAGPIRSQAIQALRQSGHADLIPDLIWHHYAAWFIKYRDTPVDGWPSVLKHSDQRRPQHDGA